MSKPRAGPPGANVNVTLDAAAPPSSRRFPCPLCGAHLDLRESRTKKPYCICNPCGVQIFFRGKAGISRLRRMLDEQDGTVGSVPVVAPPAVAAFDRLEQLRAHRDRLLQRRPILLADDDLERAISAVEGEIALEQSELARMGDSKS